MGESDLFVGQRVRIKYRGFFGIGTIQRVEENSLLVKPAKYPYNVRASPSQVIPLSDVPFPRAPKGEKYLRCECGVITGPTPDLDRIQRVVCSLCIIEQQLGKEARREKEVAEVKKEVARGDSVTAEILKLLQDKVEANIRGNKHGAKQIRKQLRALGYEYGAHKDLEERIRREAGASFTVLKTGATSEEVAKDLGLKVIARGEDPLAPDVEGEEKDFDRAVKQILQRGSVKVRKEF